jgi:hypothetical protein
MIFLAMFFSLDITFVVDEVKKRPELRRFLKIRTVPSAEQMYRFSSQFTEEQFVSLTKGILNVLISKRKANESKTIIIDGTALSIDLNWFRRKYSKAKLQSLPYSWGYSPSKGYYIGYKLTLAIDSKTLIPLAFLIHSGSPGDSKIFSEIIEELSRRRILREGDGVILDRGYYSYENYVVSLLKYRILPLILPKKNLNLSKLKKMLIAPIQWFYSRRASQYMKITQELAKKLIQFLVNPDEWISIRSKIEDVFKFCKNALSLERLHCYTRKSVGKNVALTALLLGLLLIVESGLKRSIKQAAEW